MNSIKLESLCQNVAIVFGTHDIILDVNTINVKKVERFVVTTCGKETPKGKPIVKTD